MERKRRYYAKYNSYGVDFVPDCGFWDVLVFNSKKERDDWVEGNCYDGNNYVAACLYAKNVNKYLQTKSGQTIIEKYSEKHDTNQLTISW